MSNTKIKTVYLTGYLLLLLAACSGEEPVDVEGGEHTLEVEASISGSVASRTLGAINYEKSSFEEADVIKIGTSTDNLTTSGTSYTYKKDKSGTLRWLPTTVGDGLITTGTGDYYAAYNPVGFSEILADQTDVANYKKSNRLITAATAVSGNKVNFSFYPAASKITVTVEYTDDLHVGVSVQLIGKNLFGASTSGNVTLYPVTSTGKTHMYVAIVYPGVDKQYRIQVTSKATTGSLTTDDKYYPAETTSVTQSLKAGYNYIYNFTSSFGLILNNVSVEAFKPGSGNGTDDNWSAS